MAKRWHVKWDETEIPDGDYIRAADYDQLAAMLRNAREKLLLYRKAHSGEYIGGVEFQTLMNSIDAVLGDSQSDGEVK